MLPLPRIALYGARMPQDGRLAPSAPLHLDVDAKFFEKGHGLMMRALAPPIRDMRNVTGAAPIAVPATDSPHPVVFK